MKDYPEFNLEPEKEMTLQELKEYFKIKKINPGTYKRYYRMKPLKAIKMLLPFYIAITWLLIYLLLFL